MYIVCCSKSRRSLLGISRRVGLVLRACTVMVEKHSGPDSPLMTREDASIGRKLALLGRIEECIH